MSLNFGDQIGARQHHIHRIVVFSESGLFIETAGLHHVNLVDADHVDSTVLQKSCRIAILISLLMPALGKARDTAQFAICKNNLASISKAWRSACEDGYSAEKIPGMTLGTYWITDTKRYLGTSATARATTLDCPLDIDGATYSQGSGNLSYGYNYWWLAWHPNPVWINVSADSFGTVNNPSKMIAFSDSNDDKSWDSLVGHNGTFPANPRHKDQTLASCNFVDGHVEGLTLLQTYNTSTKGEASMMNLAKP